MTKTRTRTRTKWYAYKDLPKSPKKGDVLLTNGNGKFRYAPHDELSIESEDKNNVKVNPTLFTSAVPSGSAILNEENLAEAEIHLSTEAKYLYINDERYKRLKKPKDEKTLYGTHKIVYELAPEDELIAELLSDLDKLFCKHRDCEDDKQYLIVIDTFISYVDKLKKIKERALELREWREEKENR